VISFGRAKIRVLSEKSVPSSYSKLIFVEKTVRAGNSIGDVAWHDEQ
jgi:hypothetical protein